MIYRAINVVALLVLVGCASAPEFRYYTLDMRASGTTVAAFNLELEGLRPVEALAKPEILIQAEPTRVEYYAVDRWVSNLGTLLEEKLLAEFGPPIPGRETVLVSGEIVGFGQVDTAAGTEASVKLRLSFRRESTRRTETPLLKKTYETTVPVAPATPTAVVQALSEGVEKIAGEIARDVEQVLASPPEPAS